MASPIEQIEAKLQGVVRGMTNERNARLFQEVGGYQNSIRPMPQAQLYFRGGTPGAPATGNLQEIEWRYELEMFWAFPLGQAMDGMREFYKQWPATVLGNQQLDVPGALGWTWEERVEPGAAEDDSAYVYALIEITVTTEEGD